MDKDLNGSRVPDKTPIYYKKMMINTIQLPNKVLLYQKYVQWIGSNLNRSIFSVYFDPLNYSTFMDIGKL